jgi:hypothetical protein
LRLSLYFLLQNIFKPFLKNKMYPMPLEFILLGFHLSVGVNLIQATKLNHYIN